MRNVSRSARPTSVEAMEAFVAWLEENDAGVTPHYKYSGRFQFGATCFGVVGSLTDIQTAFMDFALSDPGMGKALRETVKNQRRDSMGLDAIVYFPGVDLEPPRD